MRSSPPPSLILFLLSLPPLPASTWQPLGTSQPQPQGARPPGPELLVRKTVSSPVHSPSSTSSQPRQRKRPARCSPPPPATDSWTQLHCSQDVHEKWDHVPVGLPAGCEAKPVTPSNAPVGSHPVCLGLVPSDSGGGISTSVANEKAHGVLLVVTATGNCILLPSSGGAHSSRDQPGHSLRPQFYLRMGGWCQSRGPVRAQTLHKC